MNDIGNTKVAVNGHTSRMSELDSSDGRLGRIDLSETVNGVPKQRLYGWNVDTSHGRLTRISKHLLQVADYQREPSRQKVLTIRRDFSWAIFGTLTVSYRDGTYWVVDGQHRLLAVMGLESVQEVPVVVVEAQDKGREAGLFLQVNTNRKPLTSIEKFSARVLSGDQDARVLDQMIRDAERTLARTQSPTTITGISLFQRLMSKHRVAFHEAWEAAVELMRGRKFNLHVFEALFELAVRLRKQSATLQEPHIAKSIGGLDIERAEAAVAKANLSHPGQPLHLVIALLSELNRGKRNRIVLEGF